MSPSCLSRKLCAMANLLVTIDRSNSVKVVGRVEAQVMLQLTKDCDFPVA